MEDKPSMEPMDNRMYHMRRRIDMFLFKYFFLDLVINLFFIKSRGNQMLQKRYIRLDSNSRITNQNQIPRVHQETRGGTHHLKTPNNTSRKEYNTDALFLYHRRL